MQGMNVESVADLRRLLASGIAVEYLWFWGHTPRCDGTVDAACLSQWWPAAVEVDGHGIAERYMMWRKARLFGDERIAAAVLAAEYPRQAKRLGREVRGYDEGQWRRHLLLCEPWSTW